MISFVSGILSEINENNIVVDVNGIGFEINFPKSNMIDLVNIGDEIKIYTYMVVREDDISLFGFFTSEDKLMFLNLITVDGVGPRGAMNIISELGFSTLVGAILNNDDKLIATVSGIGIKRAKKIIIDLHDKVKKMGLETTNKQADTRDDISDAFSIVKSETIDALVSLGFVRKNAAQLVDSIECEKGITVDELLKLALKSR